MEKIRVFVSEHCQPCQILKDMIQQGQISNEDVELIDVETDEGFPYIKEVGLSGVPSAYRGNEKCEIKVDEETDIIHITCPGNKEDSPESSALSSPE